MNFDLANDLGNLVSRTVSMIEKYCDGIVPAAKGSDEFDKELEEIAAAAPAKVEAQMDKFAFNMALEEIWILVRRANKYVDEKMPWALAKDPEKKNDLDTCMHHLAEALRVVSILIYPFMHTTADKIREQIGAEGEVKWEDAHVFNFMNGNKISKGEVLFPRLDIDKELAELEALKGAQASEEVGAAEGNIPLELKPEIVYDDFDKLDLRVGTILKAEKHPNADKLLVFQVKMGTETRQIVSGVAKDFTPEEMVGKKVIVVANLKPRDLRGLESKGMILFADNGDKLAMVSTDAEDGNPVT